MYVYSTLAVFSASRHQLHCSNALYLQLLWSLQQQQQHLRRYGYRRWRTGDDVDVVGATSAVPRSSDTDDLLFISAERHPTDSKIAALKARCESRSQRRGQSQYCIGGALHWAVRSWRVYTGNSHLGLRSVPPVAGAKSPVKTHKRSSITV